MQTHNIEDLTLAFKFQREREGRSYYHVTFERGGEKLPGHLEDYSPSPLLRGIAAMARDALGFATGCPHWEFDDERLNWEPHEEAWYELYQALGGDNSEYALYAE